MSVTSMVSRPRDLFQTRRALSLATSLTLNERLSGTHTDYLALAEDKLGRRTKSSAVTQARHARFKRPDNAKHPHETQTLEKFQVWKEFHYYGGSQEAGYALGEPGRSSETGSRLDHANEP